MLSSQPILMLLMQLDPIYKTSACPGLRNTVSLEVGPLRYRTIDLAWPTCAFCTGLKPRTSLSGIILFSGIIFSYDNEIPLGKVEVLQNIVGTGWLLYQTSVLL